MPSHQFCNSFNGKVTEKYRKHKNWWVVEVTEPDYGYVRINDFCFIPRLRAGRPGLV
jgi:hypothetical protein